MPITGLPYNITPALGTNPFAFNYPTTSPTIIPTGPPGGPPALGISSTTPGGTGPSTMPVFDPSTQIPGIEQITQAINQLNLTAQQAANAGRIPNATGLETQSSNLIGQELGGQVPQDVINLLQQQGAERGAATGMDVSSPNANAAYLRALGLTSLDQQQRGEANLTAALGRNPGAPLTDPGRFVMTPYQQAMLALEQERLRLGYQPRLGAYTGPGSGGGGGGFIDTSNPYVPRVAPAAPGNFGNLLPADTGTGAGTYTSPFTGTDYNTAGISDLGWPSDLGVPIDTSQLGAYQPGGYYDFYNPPTTDLTNIMPGYGGDLSSFDFTGY